MRSLQQINLSAIQLKGDTQEQVTSMVKQLNDWGSEINAEENGGWETWDVAGRVGITVGNGLEIARYKVIRRTLFFEYTLKCGSSTSISGPVGLGLPLRESPTYDDSVYPPLGVASAYDSSTGNMYAGWCFAVAGTQALTVYWNDGTGVSSTTFPVTEATGDYLHIKGSYEIAE